MASRTSISNQGPFTTLAALADPPTRYVDACAMDYFLIEAVNALRASSAVASARAAAVEKEMIEAGLIPAPGAKENVSAGGRDPMGSAGSRDPGSGKTVTGTNTSAVDDDEEAVRARLEAIGLHVGANFAER